MTHKASFRSAFSLLACVATVMLSAVGVSAEKDGGRGIRFTKIGKPTWKLVDPHMFSAPIGTAASVYAEFVDTMKGLLPPPNHVWRDDMGIAPGQAHRGPYDSEFEEGVEANHFRESVRFRAREFSNGKGVWLVWMNVPAPGALGSSSDYRKGRVIPNALFPIHVKAITNKDGALFNAFTAEFDVLALDKVSPPFAMDGASHFPVFIADNVDFGRTGSQPSGSYEYQIDMVDAARNGWHVVGQFEVRP